MDTPAPVFKMLARGAYPACSRWTFPVTEYRIIDGDTVEVYLAVWPDTVKHVCIRVTGIDTPELHVTREKAAGLVAKKSLASWMEHLGTSKLLMCEVLEDDKYGGRWIGDFFDLAHPTGMHASEWMLHSGFAKSYTGETKEPWTDQQLADILSRGAVNLDPQRKPRRQQPVAGFPVPPPGPGELPTSS